MTEMWVIYQDCVEHGRVYWSHYYYGWSTIGINHSTRYTDENDCKVAFSYLVGKYDCKMGSYLLGVVVSHYEKLKFNAVTIGDGWCNCHG